jgi:arginase
MTRNLALVGAPSSAGAYAPGQEKAPAAFRGAGLINMLRANSIAVEDYGDASAFRWRADKANPLAMNPEPVIKTAQETAERVARAFSAGAAALVLGGDCTVELAPSPALCRIQRALD